METQSKLLKNCQTLVAFGCSNTFGYGLTDNYNKPSEHAWPNILGKHLGLQVKNLSEGGISNKEICNKILNTNFEKTDLVVVLWTHNDRHGIIENNNFVRRINAWDNTLLTQNFYKFFHNDYDQKISNYVFYNLIHFYLKEYKINHYFMHQKKEYLEFDINWNNAPFLDAIFEDVIKGHEMSKDNIHIGKSGQEAFAKAVYDSILNNKFYQAI